ncbi:M28 family peptidase [Polymorphobacter sp. PAMC 29334]|uniref:M28 family peptidase n=1 Tax=Polymorphobacter sp. PAMC 29334 TaxID=2862331 RepID=UPI001C74D2DD|nr:M28 family peptidase [Polymorphobacter sp. PAMC 29334]QYE35783.1 M28 family peptidase [Polymorphobacter sp. PAMC 29334]
MSIALIALALATSPPATDRDTSAWWATTTVLSNDAMEGRDTGSAAYERAAKIVAARLAAAGVKPAGDNGSWFQRVPMEQVALPKAGVHIAVDTTPLAFLHDITVEPTVDMPTKLDATIAFRGYCGAAVLGDVRGKVVVCWGTHRPGLPDAAARLAAVRTAGAAGIVTVADPGFAVEPPRWPFAYARSVWLAGTTPRHEAMLVAALNVAALGRVVAGSSHDAAALTVAGTMGEPLPSFDAPGRFVASFAPTRKSLTASNIIGLLPGTDAALANQHIVLSAHLDGYGFGEPVDGDALYNGTLDDAAYVALLIQLAERRHGHGYRRPVMLAAFTGEEKGLLGARWFVAHPTVPLATIAADINLDQLRPIFPLDLLTVHALDDTTLGNDARAVAGEMGIAVQKDPEPERNLLRRADQWPFLQAGIPATAFVFGYRPGGPSERVYRHWYVTGYHKPQDDIAQPMDWTAAARFNTFFYRLVDRVADQPAVPAWQPGSTLKP